MTQEEIQQKAYEVYPLDLDRHLIIEGEPYDNNKEKREAYIRGLTDSKPSLPSNLDEAAKKYELSIGSQDYCYMDIEDAFKAGAEWMSGQGINLPAHIFIPSGFKPIYDHSKGEYPAAVHLDCGGSLILEKRLQNFNHNEEVIVQIRKK